MKKKLAYAYGILCYLIALATFLYLIGFVGNLVVPKSVDSGPAGPFWQALAIDALVIGLFALQHSGMARPTFKRWWTKIIPRPIERSTYVVLTCLSLGLIFWLWRPLPVAVWNLEMAWARWLLWALYGLGWIVVFVSVQLIDSDYLFGRRQTREYLEGVKLSSPQFQTPGFYRYVRHPLVLGFLVAFWATPHMTVGHLLLAMVMTGYVLAAIQLEERNLMQRFGHRYRAYREQVPMLIPQPGSGTSQQGQWEERRDRDECTCTTMNKEKDMSVQFEDRTSSTTDDQSPDGPRQQIDTVVVGGGQAGLAMSYLLTQQDREHVILEKGRRVGESWRGRWDSFTLVTPNWQLQLPGFPYEGDDPERFLSRDEVVAYLEEYVALFDPPLRFGVEVNAVERSEEGDGYLVHTPERVYEASNVVVAAGTFQHPDIPAFSGNVPEDIVQLHSSEYRNPQALPDGPVLVVGSGQSGCQIAQELNEGGRKVTLCTGSAGPLPRRYRGKDGMWWAVELGIADQTVDELESPQERFDANPQISGKEGGQEINLHQFAREGIVLLGHLEHIQDLKAFLASDLHENLAAADKAVEQFRRGADKYVRKTGLDVPKETVSEPRDGYDQEQITQLDLVGAGIRTIIWATGFGRDYSWVRLPVFDEYGYPVQERGVTKYPGLYFLGLHWLHKLKSGLFLGVGEDAGHVAEHIAERAPA